MSERKKTTRLFRAKDIAAAPEFELAHPLNDKTKIFFRLFDNKMLSEITGFAKIGIHLVRVPGGREAFPFHRHFGEDEFLFVISGRGVFDDDGTLHDIGAGDLITIARGGQGHQIRNPHAEDLIYLTAGDRNDLEIAEFPRIQKTLVRNKMDARVVDSANLDPLFNFD